MIIKLLRIVPRTNRSLQNSCEIPAYGLWGVTELFKKWKDKTRYALNEGWKL